MSCDSDGGNRVRDQSLLSAEVVSCDQAEDVNWTTSDHWLVIVDLSGTPIDAIRPGASGRPLIIVADGGLKVDEALTSPAFRDVEPDDIGVVVVDGQRVLGVWSGPELEQHMYPVPPWKEGPDSAGIPYDHIAAPGNLSGVPTIPHITRTCAYNEDDTTCMTVETFARKPPAMPQCKNSRQLTDHTFAW